MFTAALDTPTEVLGPETRRFGWLLHCAGFILVLVIGAIGYKFVFERAEGSIVKVAASIQELRLSVQNAPVIRRTHEQLSQRLNDLKAGMATLQQRVPHSADAGKFLKEITLIAEEEALEISNFQPNKPTDNNGFTAMEVTLTGQGDFKSICSFLDRLNKLSRLSKVKNLNISSSGAAMKLPMSATLVIYFGLRGLEKSEPEGVQRG